MIHPTSIPYLITFPKIGEASIGHISFAQSDHLPFVPKRIYWTYGTPEVVKRGNHAHYELEQVLIALSGKINVTITTLHNEEHTFVLDSPDTGLFIPKMCWRTMSYSKDSVQMCIASSEYSEADYLRNHDEFKKLMHAYD